MISFKEILIILLFPLRPLPPESRARSVLPWANVRVRIVCISFSVFPGLTWSTLNSHNSNQQLQDDVTQLPQKEEAAA